jgi:hypothetical protein
MTTRTIARRVADVATALGLGPEENSFAAMSDEELEKTIRAEITSRLRAMPAAERADILREAATATGQISPRANLRELIVAELAGWPAGEREALTV